MPEITYVEIDGTTHRVEVPAGTSIMQGAVNHMVPGIEGDCGGLCACGTCHVYIPEAWADRCGEKGELESAMLEFAFGVEKKQPPVVSNRGQRRATWLDGPNARAPILTM